MHSARLSWHGDRRLYPLFIAAVALLIAAVWLPGKARAQSPCGDSVTVVAGDTLREIAQRCNTSISALLQANPDITNRNLIYVGQTIRIPQDEQPAQPSIRVVPEAAPPGATIDVFVTGFPSTTDLTIGIGPGQLINTVSVVTNAQGQAETNLTVPEVVEPTQRLDVIAYVPVPNGTTAETRFTVTSGDDGEQPEVDVAINPTSGPPGTAVQVSASGLSANATVEIGAGPVESEYDIIAQAQTDAQGDLSRNVRIPNLANPGEQWVIALTPVGSPADYISNPFTVTEPAGDGDQNLFTRTNIYLIALEDEGRTGMQIGCGDSVVPVEVQIEPTLAVLTAALEALVNLDERFYGQSGLYNALYRSDLSVEDVRIEDGEAIVQLSGQVSLGGVCDVPRFEAQLRQTALQFYTVDSVSITVDGQPLDQVIQ